jgi:hypothetical protein
MNITKRDKTLQNIIKRIYGKALIKVKIKETGKEVCQK